MPLVRAGKLLKPHGIAGFMRVVLSGDSQQSPSSKRRYWLYDQRSSELLELAGMEIQHKPGSDTCLLRANGWTVPEPLRTYQGLELVYLARPGELPREPGEVYFFELAGLAVRDLEGQVLGRVADVMQTGAGVLLELDSTPPRLIPFTERDVPEVNLDAGYLVTSYGQLKREDAR